jgi:hypothetical protein
MVRKHDPDAVNLRLRIKGSLLHRLERAAPQNHRSLNGEIIDRLERSFAREDTKGLIEEVARGLLDQWERRERQERQAADRQDLERLESAVRELQRSKSAGAETPDQGESLGEILTKAAQERRRDPRFMPPDEAPAPSDEQLEALRQRSAHARAVIERQNAALEESGTARRLPKTGEAPAPSETAAPKEDESLGDILHGVDTELMRSRKRGEGES